ncbi:hypothetical protein DSM112329_02740 [Paraconexibacter sp. AEG42_29]|uniref:Uncharacterized protein n=1 Tax=Paraconexibacter sp. AEG42_29 TaxID=2997339 RepID=A0AAU7AWQ4_9ACTN
MSDDWLQLIPTDPELVPATGAITAARAAFEVLVGPADEVLVTVTDHVCFIDAGANHERISCPRCEAEIDQAWWVRALDAASDAAFADLTVHVPCCRARLSLNDLVYDWPAGFARFVLEARNPDVSELEPAQVAALAATLGTPLRVVWTHI